MHNSCSEKLLMYSNSLALQWQVTTISIMRRTLYALKWCKSRKHQMYVINENTWFCEWGTLGVYTLHYIHQTSHCHNSQQRLIIITHQNGCQCVGFIISKTATIKIIALLVSMLDFELELARQNLTWDRWLVRDAPPKPELFT